MTGRIATAEFDRMVEAGEDIDEYLDWDHAVMASAAQASSAHEPIIMQVSMDPAKVIALDHRARRCGQTRGEYVNDLIDAALAVPA